MNAPRVLMAIAIGLVGCTDSRPQRQPPPDSGTPADSGTIIDTGAAVSDAGAADSGVAEPDAGQVDTGAEDVPLGPDPFAPMPDTSEGLTNVSSDLSALLENGALEGACDAYEADPGDRRKKLLCGKSMYFYETFGTGGVPAVLIDFFTQNFPNDVGPGFELMGMVADPGSPELRPLGLAPGAQGDVEEVVYTCAACHFGRLPDGRYAVGQANHEYEYGTQILAISLVAGSVSPSFDPADHHPAAIAKVQPMMDVLANDAGLRLRLLLDLLPLIGAAQPMFTPELEGWYASWPPGTMDFMIAPLPLDDGVHTVSKIIPLWDLPTLEEQEAYGMPHSLLAWSGGARSLENFLDGFVKIGGGPVEEWPPEKFEPLIEYIRSLRAPENPAPAPATQVAAGRVVFDSEGCLECHQGPRGSGIRAFDFDEIGTDDAMMQWGAPNANGEPCCGLGDGGTQLTLGLKSPRLSGLWAAGRFLHNGALGDLDALFCLNGPRPASLGDALGTQGHEMTCDLSAQDKEDLIAFLESL